MIKFFASILLFLLLQSFSVHAETNALDADTASQSTSIEKSSADDLMNKGIASHKLNTKEGAEQSVIYFVQSAEMGNANAARLLYEIYMRGGHITIDKKKAYQWLHKAAELGSIRPAHSLGHAYQQTTKYFNKDLDKSFLYFKQAALAGMSEAKRDLGLCFYFGQGTAKNEKKAEKWMQEAATENVSLAQYRMGLWSVKGSFTAHNWFKKALKLFKAEAEQGNKEAELTYAYMHDKGYGVDEDNQVARKGYLKLANENNSEAQYLLALMYLTGDGVTKNIKTGKKWLLSAYKLGDPFAKGILERNGWL
ncbi:MAG: sel1 repeat family protein [Methylophaga sp.]|nr:sel1 repeat family protein [Methylophaga sp.]